MPNHTVVSRADWLEQRKELLKAEKALTRERDRVSRLRLDLPWVEVTKDYAFEGPNGSESLASLFGANSQLIVYHFMFPPGCTEVCSGCSLISDHFDGANFHLPHHDVTLLAVSRAPYAELLAYKKRMGWQFKWVSSQPSDFNFDYNVSFTDESLKQGPATYNYQPYQGIGEAPGFSVFYKDENGAIFHTYSTYSRGGDLLINTYNFLDMAPLGRNETTIMDWVRRHDEYESNSNNHNCCN